MSEPTVPTISTSGTAARQPRLTSREYLAKTADQANSTSAYDEAVDYDAAAEQLDSRDEMVNLPDSELQKSRIAPGMYRPQPETTVLEWQAPSRVFKKRSRRFFTTVVVIALLISLILFFAGQVLPVAVVISIVFVVYVMSVVPPTILTHKITTFGVRMDTELYYWQELGRFWFETKYNQTVVNIEVSRLPNRLTLLLADQSEEVMRTILSEVLLEERPPLTQFERLTQWLEKHIPLDIE